jgi:hypothetical protein
MSDRQEIILTEEPQRRRAALRFLMDWLVAGADSAPNRDSEQWLRNAAGAVGNALSAERRGALQ